MIPDLTRATLDRHAKHTIQRVLSLAPWCWPLAQTSVACALKLVPAGKPHLQPGQVPLISVSPTTTSLWILSLDEEHSLKPSTAVPFGKTAIATWETVLAALPRSTPLLWSSVDRLRFVRLEAQRVVGVPADGQIEVRETLLDGTSFGLAFFLAAASASFGQPIADDIAASANVDANGMVSAVGAIDRKVELLASCAPSVRRLLVATSQRDEARKAASGHMEVVGIDNAGEALDLALGGQLPTLLLRSGSDPIGRSELVRSFLELAVAGRSAVVDWTPVHAAALLALERWKELDALDRETLDLVCMIAARHEGHTHQATIPRASWFSTFPVPVRIDLTAQLVQQSTDTGTPSATDALALAERFLVRGTDAFVPHLRLLGAVGRLLAATGRTLEALEAQREAAHGLVDRMESREATYPLAEWCRLSGVLQDRGAFEDTQRMTARVRAQLPPNALAYVELSKARAMVMLGIDDGQVDARLSDLSHDPLIPAHVRWSAARWRARLQLSRCDKAERIRIVEQAIRSMGVEQRKTDLAGRYLDLIDLDWSVFQADTETSAQALRRLVGRQPGLIGHLMHDRELGLDAARHVAIHYPY